MKIQEMEINGRTMKVAMADNFFLRLRGMIGRQFDGFDAMAIVPCNQVHPLHMKFPIDVLYLNKEGMIIHKDRNVKPGRRLKKVRGSYIVLELPA